MRRIVPALVLLLVLIGAPAASGGHNADVHSDNMRLVATWNDGGAYRQGSDLAFWGKRAVVGNYGTPGGFWAPRHRAPRPARPLGQLVCPGPQNDVSIWNDLVFLGGLASRRA